MLLSIVIPTFNRSSLLGELIEKIGTGTEINYEIIIVDDGSTDNTKEEIQKKLISYKNLKYIYQENKERGAARNTGTLASTGDFVTFFDSDDLPNDNYFKLIEATLRKERPLWVAFACDRVIVKGGHETRQYFKFHSKELTLWRENYLGCQGVFLRRDVAMQNLFSENRQLSGLEDWELWLRISKEHALLWIPVPIMTLRDHAERSMNTFNPESFKEKVALLYNSTQFTYQNDPRWDLNRSQFLASCLTFVAVHLASIRREWRHALSLLAAAVVLDARVITNKRFYATVIKIFRNLYFRRK